MNCEQWRMCSSSWNLESLSKWKWKPADPVNADEHHSISVPNCCHDDFRLTAIEIQMLFKSHLCTIVHTVSGSHWCLYGVQLTLVFTWCLACASVHQFGQVSRWCSACASIYMVFSWGLCLRGVRPAPVSAQCSAWLSVCMVFNLCR